MSEGEQEQPSPDRPATLEARGLGRRDPRGPGWLIRGIDLTIGSGARLAVVGPSGAGKTVLLRALALLDPLDEGTVLWQGRTLQGEAVPPFRRRVVYLHQRPPLFEGTVEANLKIPYALRSHRDGRYDEARVLGILTELGRDRAFLSKSYQDLSGGEAQIVALVRAVQLDPAILLLDEATSSLDRTTALAAESLLDRWQAESRESRALVWVTHDPDQARRVADRQVAVRAGRLEQQPEAEPAT